MLIELSADGQRYERLADTSDDFHTSWDTVALLLAGAATPLTRQEIRDAWPEGVPRPHDATLWRWLDRAVELGLALRSGRGTKNEPYRYGLARGEWRISLGRRKATFFDERLADDNGFRVVHDQHHDGRPPHRCLAHENGAVPAKMLRPLVSPWVEEPGELLRHWVDTRDIWPFMRVAMEA